jgi:hypothetical protein
MKIYIAGKITGDDDYKNKFARHELLLSMQGHTVMNPSILPEGFEYEQYIHICEAMIDCCDAVAMLPDWRESKGAMYEKDYAATHRKAVAYLSEQGELQ